MPLILPKNLIDPSFLEANHIFTMQTGRAESQDIRPLKLAIVNLMPTKEETEIQLVKMLSNTPLQVKIDFLTTASYQSRHTDLRRLDALYKTFPDILGSKYDGMIITGAPVETMDYDDILYWEELKAILDYARENVYSTLFICWAAQAALYYYYGIEAHRTDQKIFGVYEFKKQGHAKVLRGFDDVFSAPHSRHAYVDAKDLEKVDDLEVLASRPDTGLALATSKDNRFIFNFGHWEYDKYTLDKEYRRDLEAGLAIQPPKNYYWEDDPNQEVRVSWRAAGNLFFSNWLNYCVYQATPFSLDEIQTKSVSKFGGSSLADAGQFRKVKDIVEEDGDRRVVIVSAPGKRDLGDRKITDRLIDDYQLKSEVKEIDEMMAFLKKEKEKLLADQKKNKQEIDQRFLDIADQLDLSEDFKSNLKTELDQLEDASDRDYIVSRGEYLNARIMAEYLGYRFLDAKDLISFDQEGKVDLEASTRKIQDQIQIKEGDRVVVPGFYGADPSGKVRTFKRGGSDFTGSLLAYALNSKVYENWTDVDGVMTADPNKDQSAKKIPKLSYEELSDLLDKGAQVYQKEAIAPVKRKNIALRFLNTNNVGGTGTEVQD